MKCANCGAENPSDNNFCGRCGVRIAASHTELSTPGWLLEERRASEREAPVNREPVFIDSSSWTLAQRKRWATWIIIALAFLVVFTLSVSLTAAGTLVGVAMIITACYLLLIISAILYVLRSAAKKLHG